MIAPRRVALRTPVRRMGRPVVRAARRVRGRSALRRALSAIRAARDARLVLTYHRIAPRDEPRYEIVPTIPLHLFREQLTTFSEIGRIVPLAELLDAPVDPAAPLRLALTFDDDYATHVEHVLPVLAEMRLEATFFLSGRSLHGLGPYWFERLEALVAARGVSAASALLGVPEEPPSRLPHRCQGDAARIAIIEEHAPPAPTPLGPDGLTALAEAGMPVGFHTLHHHVLPALDDDHVHRALIQGRDDLAAHVGHSLEWLSYPHGKADDRVAAMTEAAGYTAAWTTQPGLLGAADDRYRLGRWEPQPLSTPEVVTLLGRVLRRAA